MKKTTISNETYLREIWNQALINFDFVICTEELKDCSLLDVKILKLLYENPEYKIKELITLLGVPNSTMTNAINRLTKKNLLERRLSEQDLRSFDLALTPYGKLGVERHYEGENNLFKQLLAPLTKEEQATFLTLCEKVFIKKRN